MALLPTASCCAAHMLWSRGQGWGRAGAGGGLSGGSVPLYSGANIRTLYIIKSTISLLLIHNFFSVTFPKCVGINNEAMLAKKQKRPWADLLTWQLHFIKSIKDWSIRDLSRGGQKKWKAATEEFLLEQNLWSLAEMRHHDSSAKDVITQKWHQHGTKNYYHLIIFYARHFGNRYSR